MARLARVVIPNVPHYIIQRGNRGQDTFFEPADYKAYLEIMAEWCDRCRVTISAYSLLPNHVHLIATPKTYDGLARAVGEAHRRYTRRINDLYGWSGFLWQGRFASFPMDPPTWVKAACYVEQSPVMEGVSRSAKTYRWSSAKAHLKGKDDALVKVAPLQKKVGDWAAFLKEGISEEDAALIEAHSRTGRPLGKPNFVSRLEDKLDRTLAPQKRGPKPKNR
ncbi:MAG: transposase [Pseudomonadota bacterium]